MLSISGSMPRCLRIDASVSPDWCSVSLAVSLPFPCSASSTTLPALDPTNLEVYHVRLHHPTGWTVFLHADGWIFFMLTDEFANRCWFKLYNTAPGPSAKPVQIWSHTFAERNFWWFWSGADNEFQGEVWAAQIWLNSWLDRRVELRLHISLF